ncbi:phage head completion protein [Pedobacter duraquae]|nr:head-tail adaptor protein [Pedobacter duraquae]
MYQTSIKDAGGGQMPGGQALYWATSVRVYTIKNKRDAESYTTNLEEPKEFVMRYRPDKTVQKNMIVKYLNTEYTIQSITNTDDRNRELVLVCLTLK